VLLRPEWWLEEQAELNDKDTLEVGDVVEISVPECGIDGAAEVLGLGRCPEILPGPGRVVTGTFKHSSANILDLYVEGLPAPIGTTANHPFWSEDRQAFVHADSLWEDERLGTLEGTRRVMSLVTRNQAEPVFNLEVQLDHSYRVSESGVLVHNAIGVPCNALDRMVRRLKGIRAGNQRAIESVEGFGSRFGSKFRGRGPRPDSDLDIFVRGAPGLEGSRHQAHVQARIRQIIRDFEIETGIRVDLNADWLFPIFDPFRHGALPPVVRL
jgi:predicted nucleotidyltransferase